MIFQNLVASPKLGGAILYRVHKILDKNSDKLAFDKIYNYNAYINR